MSKYDVVIIGGGPAGSTTGLYLSNYADLDVAIFEKDGYPGENNVCAGGIDTYLVDELKLPKSLIEKKIQHLDVFSNKKRYHSMVITDKVTVKREIFDKYLAERAEKNGNDLYVNTEVVSVKKGGKNWEVTTSDGRKFSSRVVVFADGPTSKIRRNYGLGFQHDQNNVYLGAIQDLICNDAPSTIEMYLDYGISLAGYGWLFPKSDVLNIGVCILKRYARKQSIRKSLNNVFNKYIRDRYDVGEVVRERRALIPCRVSKKICEKGGLLAVGDAAGFVSPFTGAGISSAIDSGKKAANVIAKALAVDDSNILEDYYKKIAATNWHSSYKKQGTLLKFLGLSPILYHWFFTRIFVSRMYANMPSPFWKRAKKFLKG